MTVRAEKGILLAVVLFAVALLVWSMVRLFGPYSIPLKNNSAQTQATVRLYSVCTKIQRYVDTHPAFATDGKKGMNIDSLRTAGALTYEEAAFLHDHSAVFYGFDPQHPDDLAFEAVFTNANSAWRIAMRNDGSVLRQK